jgi:hypothetical protein
VRCLYVDLDGTLLGRDGSLLHDEHGELTLLGARAVEACLRAGVEVVPVSGRRQANVAEISRLIGARSYVFEAGAVVVLDGEEHWLTGDYVPRDGRTVTTRSRRPAPPTCCSSASPGGSRSTPRGTPGARSRTSSAGWWTPPRPRRCWPSTVTPTCAWSTTARPTGARA